MTVNQKRGKRYDVEFKARAVALVRERQCKPSEVAKDLGITTETLERWINERVEITLEEKDKIEQLESENRKLRKVLADQKEISEILKKAAAIFINP